MGFTVKAFQSRLIKFNLTLKNSAGNNIAIGTNDRVDIRIGSDDNEAELWFDSSNPSANGSSCTKANPSVVTLAAADLVFAPGVYDIEVNLFDNSDGGTKHVQTGILMPVVTQATTEATSAIISDAEVITALGKVGTALSAQDQALLLTFRPGVIQAIKHHIGYDPQYKEDRTEYHPMGDVRIEDEYLLLEHLPVREITQIKEDYEAHFGQGDDAFTADAQVEGTHYVLERDAADGTMSLTGHVRRIGSDWPTDPGSIRVRYTSGYTDDEFRGNASTGLDASGIKTAALLTIKKISQTVVSAKLLTGADAPAPITSERAGDYSYSVNAEMVKLISGQTVQLTPEAAAYLEPYVSYNKIGY